MTRTICATIMLLLTTTVACAASFDCEKAAAPDEKAICGDRSLNDADVKMTTMFEMEVDLVPMGARDTLRGTQKAWLARRTACQADVGCLKSAYGQRLIELEKVFKDIASQGPH